MKPGRGKGKGSAFERLVGKRLSLWLTDGESGTQLIRSVLSGGWSGRGSRQAGDLAANGPAGERFRTLYAVECKHRKEISLYSFWTKSATSDDLPGWWSKLTAEVDAAGLKPLLVFRENGMPIMVAMREGDSPSAVRRYAYFPTFGLRVFLFEDLLAQDPQRFMKEE